MKLVLQELEKLTWIQPLLLEGRAAAGGRSFVRMTHSETGSRGEQQVPSSSSALHLPEHLQLSGPSGEPTGQAEK